MWDWEVRWSCAIGVVAGTYAGYKGGLLDNIFLRISEIFMAFPQIILVLLLVSITGQSLWNLIAIFIVTGWGSVYRNDKGKNAVYSRGGICSSLACIWIE